MDLFEDYETQSPQDLFSLKGRTIVVVGGSTGIGLGMAAGMGLAGAHVVLVARSEENLSKAREWLEARKIETSSIAKSITDEALTSEIDRLLEREKKRMDGLVLSAAAVHLQPFLSYDRSKAEEIIDVNLKAQFLVAQWAARRMKEGGGNILFLSSGAALRAMPTNPVYAATKGAIRSLTKTLAVELARYGIRVNALIPGWVETPMTRFAKAVNPKGPDKPTLYETVLPLIPMGRWGRPNDFAGIGVWLMSEASSYVTGQEFVVDGGMLSA